MDLHLEGKNVLITGGSKNLGRAIAKRYLEEGANVIFTWHRDQEAAQATLEALQPLAKGVFAQFRADANIEEDARATFAFCRETMGPVDVLINNACEAGKERVLIQDMTDEFWDHEMMGSIRPMYLHTWLLCNECLQEKRGCHIVSITAREGVKIFSVAGKSAFAAGKAAVMMYNRTLAYQMAPYGIIVKGLIPGLVLGEEDRDNPAYSYLVEDEKPGPFRTPADPDEVAALAAFLGSNLSTYMAGANVDITGGNLL